MTFENNTLLIRKIKIALIFLIAFLFVVFVKSETPKLSTSGSASSHQRGESPAAHSRNQLELLMGRFDTSNMPSYLSYDWSGVSFSYTFSGTGAVPAISLDDNENYYQVLLYAWAGNVPTLRNETLLMTKARTNHTNNNIVTYPLFGDELVLDPEQRYTLVLSKRTEASFGIVKLYGFVPRSSSATNFKVYTSVARYLSLSGFGGLPRVTTTKNDNKRHNSVLFGPKSIEFLGDSLSCGYGNEGKYPCKFSASTENALKSFPIVTAHTFNASYSLTCWRGKGLVRNVNDSTSTSAKPFPAYYPRTLANDASKLWTWQYFVPEAVVITLGTNDFSTEPRPSYTEFSTGYHRLLNTILDNYYPRKPEIFCVSFGSIAAYGSFTEKIVKERNDKRVHYVKLPDFKREHQGCGNHPTVEGDWEAAQVLISAIATVYSQRSN